MNTATSPSLMLTDYIVLSLIAMFFISGWLRGFIRSLIGPLALLSSAFVSTLYFGLHRNIASSILFVLVGTILLTVLGHLALYAMRQTVAEENRNYIFWGSRLLGGLVTIFWKGSLTLAVMVLLTALPPTIFGLKEAQKDIQRSLVYYALDTNILSKVQVVRDVKEFLACIEDRSRAEAVQSTEEFKALMQDQKMQDLLADPEIINDINNKDVLRLVLNKKVVELMNDKEFVGKFIAFTKVLYQSRGTSPVPAQ